VSGSERELSASGASEDRHLRADAKLNRRHILEAAEEIFAKDGVSVPVDAIAERAGVGVGTLYRHFPTKEALFESVVVSRIDKLVEAATAADTDQQEDTAPLEDTAPQKDTDDEDDEDDVTEAFFSFLLRIADQAILKRDLLDALGASGIDFKSRCADRVQELKGALDSLRQRAVDCGGIRDDVNIEQIMALVIGACQGVGRSEEKPQEPRQLVAIICDGLRARHWSSRS